MKSLNNEIQSRHYLFYFSLCGENKLPYHRHVLQTLNSKRRGTLYYIC